MYDPGQLYVDPILTDMSTGWPEQELYGQNFFPLTPVNTQSGRYRTFDRSGRLIFPSRREPGTEAYEVRGRKWSQDTFNTKEHSLASPIHDEERQELNSLGGLANPVFGGALQIDPELDATDLITRSIFLEHEVKVSTVVRDTATYPGGSTVTLAGSQQWSDYTFVTALDVYSIVSNPVGDIQAAIRKIWTLLRIRPNLLAIPTMGVSYIENHPRIIDRFKTFSLLQPDAFRLLTGFDGKIVLVDSTYNAADNVDAAENIVDLWGKDVWIGFVDPGVSENTHTFGKTFSQKYPDGSVRPTDRWYEPARKTTVVRTSQKYDLKVVSASAGYLIKTAFGSGAW